MPTPAPSTISFNSKEWFKLFTQGKYEALSTQFLSVLRHFQATQLTNLGPQEQYFINQFVKTFLALFTEVDFKIPDAHIQSYIASNHVLANLVAISSFQTTDAHLQLVIPQEGNFIKLLTLLNARCKTKFDRKVIFDTQSDAASCWYAHYSCAYYGTLQSRTGYENLREHFAFTHPNLVIKEQYQEAYFGSTYAGGDLDQIVKPVVNRTARSLVANIPPFNGTPNPKKIALVSGFWATGTSVYRTYSECIRALREKYHLTFVALGDREGADHSLFDEVIAVPAANGNVDLTGLNGNQFQMAIFPDIGMFDLSILLANMRVAPIQVGLTGHPVSTFGALTDYFISGADVEIPERPEKNYSERLVLIPGSGVVHNLPLYTLQRPAKPSGVLYINGLFWAQKINHPYVQTLKKIIARANKPVRIRIFAGNSTGRANDRIPFIRDLNAELGAENVEIMPPLAYPDYMRAIEEGGLTLDSYPFGGSNTASDTLYARVPLVGWESDKWYGRIGSYMLRQLGLGELAAGSEEEYINIATRLINDDAYRADVTARLEAADLENTIYTKACAPRFARAVDYIMEHHEEMQNAPSREPVRIS